MSNVMQVKRAGKTPEGAMAGPYYWSEMALYCQLIDPITKERVWHFCSTDGEPDSPTIFDIEVVAGVRR